MLYYSADVKPEVPASLYLTTSHSRATASNRNGKISLFIFKLAACIKSVRFVQDVMS